MNDRQLDTEKSNNCIRVDMVDEHVHVLFLIFFVLCISDKSE